jgi:hypothetical protein
MPLVGIPAELTGGDLAAGMGGATYYFATLLPHQVSSTYLLLRNVFRLLVTCTYTSIPYQAMVTSSTGAFPVRLLYEGMYSRPLI